MFSIRNYNVRLVHKLHTWLYLKGVLSASGNLMCIRNFGHIRADYDQVNCTEVCTWFYPISTKFHAVSCSEPIKIQENVVWRFQIRSSLLIRSKFSKVNPWFMLTYNIVQVLEGIDLHLKLQCHWYVFSRNRTVFN